jgi:hypothetical protein
MIVDPATGYARPELCLRLVELGARVDAVFCWTRSTYVTDAVVPRYRLRRLASRDQVRSSTRKNGRVPAYSIPELLELAKDLELLILEDGALSLFRPLEVGVTKEGGIELRCSGYRHAREATLADSIAALLIRNLEEVSR